MFAPPVYWFLICVLIATIFLSHDVKGSRSWLDFGPVRLQPAEFAKFATALYLAKFMNTWGYSIHKLKNFIKTLGIVLLPMAIIVMQKETGSALVYFAFFLVFYREGMAGSILFSGISAVLYFVIGLRFQADFMGYTPTPIGRFSVLLMIILFTIGMVGVYCENAKAFWRMILGSLGTVSLALLFSFYVIPFDVTYVMVIIIVALIGYLIYLGVSERGRSYFFIALCPFILLWHEIYIIKVT
jgi:rod shape determining protein RodA